MDMIMRNIGLKKKRIFYLLKNYCQFQKKYPSQGRFYFAIFPRIVPSISKNNAFVINSFLNGVQKYYFSM